MKLFKNRRSQAGGFFFLGLALVPGPALADPVCPAHTPPAGLLRIAEVMATGRFVGYSPTSLKVFNGQTTPADDTSMLEDLKVLRTRFDGLITYSVLNGAERIPDLAASLGYRAVIMGIYDITNAAERANVVAAAKRQPNIVVGASVGNEVVYGKRASFSDIGIAMDRLRRASPQLAITTTEPFHVLVGPDAKPVLRASDFMLANVHPVFEPWFRAAPDANAAEFVTSVTADLAKVYCGPILVKETGVPTAPAAKGFTPQRQASFYRALQKQFAPNARRAFAYFSAYDAAWRVYDAHPVAGDFPEEAHWGLYDEKRNPKPVVEEIPLLGP
jgi:exo-beta-1,3-glucanase (GH17 family)